MNAMPNFLSDEQSAFAFVTAQGRNIETAIYKRRYPTVNYAEHVPVVTEGNSWAIGTQFRVSDSTGQAKIISGKAKDMPFGKTTRSLATHDFFMIGAGWEWSLEETEQGMLYNVNVTQDDAMGAADNVERLLYDIAITGSDERNIDGLINSSLVANADAAATGSGSSTFWANKTVDQILTDWNTGLSTVRTQSNEVEWADTVRLPPEAFRFIATKRLGTDGSMGTLLEYIQKNNIYTAETGQALNIAPLRDLANIADGERGRAVFYRRDPQVLRFHLPMPRRVLPVHRVGLMHYQQGVIARTGGTEIRLPGAMFYLDGITAEQS
jgi:hypothetical protein